MKQYPVHITDMRAFKSCRQLWDFTSPLRRNLTPRWPNKHLWEGTGVHIAFGRYYDPDDPFNAEAAMLVFNNWLIRSWADLEEQDLPPDRWEDIFQAAMQTTGILQHYFEWAPKHDKFTALGTEIPFRIPLPLFPGKQVFYEGKADGLVRWEDGMYWLLEHKTTSSYPDFSLLFLDEQCISYQWAAQIDHRFEGTRPVGTVYNFLFKALPTIPRVLKRGGLSIAKNIRTTYEVYLAEIEKQGLSAANYQGVLARLAEQENPFFRRVRIKRQPRAMKTFGQRFMNTIAEMVDPQIPIVPSPNWWSCKTCPFRSPCAMIANGFSPEPLLKANYRKREAMPSPVPEKICRRCGEWKPLEDFAKDHRSKDGLQSWCRVCKSNRRRSN